MNGWGFIYWLAHRCRSNKCFLFSEYTVYWPGQTIFLCIFCTRQAKHIAEAMGFDLATTELAEARRRRALSVGHDSAIRFSLLELD